MNFNVRLSMLVTFFDGVASSVWGYSALAAFILLEENSSKAMVGYAEGLQGFAQALSALPAGAISDRYARRDAVLRYAGCVGFFAAALSVASLVCDKYVTEVYAYGGLCFALCFWGAFAGVWTTCLESLFADSVQTGARTQLYTRKFVLGIVANALGPAMNMVLFYFLGNTWTLGDLRVVLYVGFGLSVIPSALLFFFDDSRSLGGQSEAVRVVRRRRLSSGDDSTTVEEQQEEQDNGGKTTTTAEKRGGLVEHRHIPPILAISDCLFGLASGMTIKFFPLFFLEECHLSPVGVNAIYVVVPLLMALTSMILQRVAKRFGRIHAAVSAKVVGMTLLFVMGAMPKLWATWWIICPVYIVRTVLMNAPSPLLKSCMMDFVDKRQRGKWNALDSITSFGWSGSAVLGGILVDRFGYSLTFYLTAALQVVAWFPLLLLLPLVPTESALQEESERGEGGGEEEAERMLRSPLLDDE